MIDIKPLDINLLVSNSSSNKKWRIDRNSLYKLILNPTSSDTLSILSVNLDNDTIANIEHWQKRNWGLSLNYYLWSITGDLTDNGKDYEEKQKEVLQEYITVSSPIEPNIVHNNAIKLPSPTATSKMSLGEVLFNREALLATPKRNISQEDLSYILENGLSEYTKHQKLDIKDDILNAVNSFGTAFDILIIIYNVDGLNPGFYFYNPKNHAITPYKLYDDLEMLREQMYTIQIDQLAAKTASFAIALVCHFERYQWRYRHEGALKHLYINCGQIFQRAMLYCSSLDYKTHLSPAIKDSDILDLIGFDRTKYQVMSILSIG